MQFVTCVPMCAYVYMCVSEYRCIPVHPYKKNKVATTMCVHNKVVSRLSQPCGDSLATWCSSYKVVTTLW